SAGTRDAHGEFHPHAPGWAINLVLIILALGTFGALALNFVGPHAGHGGWAAGMVEASTARGVAENEAGRGTFLGFDPHAVMYYISAVVGLIGIAIAWWLHLAGRTSAARRRAADLPPALA